MKRLDPGTSFHKNSCLPNLFYFLYTQVLNRKRSTLLEVLVATPMWNYTVPYVLKQYLDILVQPGINLNEMDNLAEAAIFRNSCCCSMTITISCMVLEKQFFCSQLGRLRHCSLRNLCNGI
jgi:hypothetical protein